MLRKKDDHMFFMGMFLGATLFCIGVCVKEANEYKRKCHKSIDHIKENSPECSNESKEEES